jgi:hypothetical protein
MFKELDSYLIDAASAELKDSINEAHKAFDKIGLPNYQDGFVDILMMDDVTDRGDTLTKIINLTIELQKSILNEHEIVLIDDITINARTEFIVGLVDISNFSDKNTILKIASSDNGPNEILAEVISLVAHRTIDELLFEIESVSIACIGKLKEFAESVNETVDEDELIIKQKFINNLKQFCSLINNDKLDIIKLIMQGLDVGYMFITYANIIGRDLEIMSPKDAACELLAMALISTDGSANPLAIINSNIDNYIADIDTITKITVIVTELILKLQATNKE